VLIQKGDDLKPIDCGNPDGLREFSGAFCKRAGRYEYSSGSRDSRNHAMESAELARSNATVVIFLTLHNVPALHEWPVASGGHVNSAVSRSTCDSYARESFRREQLRNQHFEFFSR
jgi:hypothetical protein